MQCISDGICRLMFLLHRKKPLTIKLVIMDLKNVVDGYKQQIAALGERYTFSQTMRDFYRLKIHCYSGASDQTMFDICSQFCKFYQDELETTRQISRITSELDDIQDLIKRDANK